MEEAKGEVDAEIRPELYRQVAGDRDFLREQRAELILQLCRKDEEIRKRQQRLDSLTLFSMGMLRQLSTREGRAERRQTPFHTCPLRLLTLSSSLTLESWAIMRLPGFVPNIKQVADSGVNGRGRIYDSPNNWDSDLAQVKKNYSASGLRDFMGVANNAKAALGCFITLDRVESKAFTLVSPNASMCVYDPPPSAATLTRL